MIPRRRAESVAIPSRPAEHAGSVRVLHTLRPFAVAMAGPGEYDPFKD